MLRARTANDDPEKRPGEVSDGSGATVKWALNVHLIYYILLYNIIYYSFISRVKWCILPLCNIIFIKYSKFYFKILKIYIKRYIYNN